MIQHKIKTKKQKLDYLKSNGIISNKTLYLKEGVKFDDLQQNIKINKSTIPCSKQFIKDNVVNYPTELFEDTSEYITIF